MSDLINRQVAIYTICMECHDGMCDKYPCGEIKALEHLPSEEPTLYGYSLEHLELIARVLQKEDLPPERIAEALTDIDRIVAIVKGEFEESLRKAVEQWQT